MNRAIFLDRDGTIIEDNGYICRLSQSFIYDFSAEAISRMNKMNFMVFGITNQSSIARGICTPEQVETLNEEIKRILAKSNAQIETFYYSPYHVDGIIEAYKKEHHWRKPLPGMLLQAAEDYDINLSESYMMGDNITDIQAGINAGCKTVLVLTGQGHKYKKILKEKNISPDIITDNILTAIEVISSCHS
jgi:D-glycero-D-manno-heptose 1,7-bisphosphate phosphatase